MTRAPKAAGPPLSPVRQLVRRVSRGMAGTVGLRMADAALALVISIVLARLLGAESFGMFAYAVAVVGVLRPFTVLGLPNLLIQLASTYRVEGRWGLLHGLLRRSEQAVLVIALLVTLGAMALGAWLVGDRGGDAYQVYMLALVSLPFVSFVSLREAELRGFEHVVAGTAPDAVVRPALFILLALAVHAATASRAPQLYILVDGAAAVAAFVVAHVWYRRSLPAEVTRAVPAYETRQWLRTSMPFSAWSVLTILNLKIDVLLLGLFVEPRAIAFYVVASQIVRSINVVCINAVNLASAPYLARFHAEKNLGHLQNLVTWSTWLVFLLSLPAALVLLLWSGPLLALIFGPEYAAAKDVSAVLAAALLVRTAIGAAGQVLMMTGHARILTVQTAAGTVLAAVLCVALIPALGAVGAAIGSSVALVAVAAANALAVYRRVGVVPTILRRPRLASREHRP